MDEKTQNIIKKIKVFAEQERLFSAPADRPLRLCAAVSGGADSMAMLHLLRMFREEFGYELTACHVNHGLRGETADRDEAFVRSECARLGVPLWVLSPAEVGFSVPPHPGEDWARKLRYACFEQLRSGIDCIATAHTATDQAETLLFRLARGTGLHGAGGIRPMRPGFCRPLLCLTRQETELLCHAFGQAWVTDETNASDAYARNRLRHGALPALRSANGAAEENLARFCEKAARADAYFVREAEKLLSGARLEDAEKAMPGRIRQALHRGFPVWRIGPLQAADPLIREAALHHLASPVRDAEEKYIRLLEQLVERGSGAVQLTERVRFCGGEGFFWQETGAEMSAPAQLLCQPFFPVDGAEYPLPGEKKLKVCIFEGAFPEKIQGVHKKDLKNRADYARITMLYPALVLRTRRPGDHFRPAGRNVGKQLRKWMNEKGIPPEERDRLPLLAAGSEVLWIGGWGFAQGLAPDADTTWELQLELETREEEHHEYAR